MIDNLPRWLAIFALFVLMGILAALLAGILVDRL